MNKVITINLNGRAYQLEEAGYAALTEYLEKARAALKGNPDLVEIMADLEQAIADKCDARLSQYKNVMESAEIDEIIRAMGPVEGKTEDEKKSETNEKAEEKHTTKRLYRILEDRWLMGVCSGIAAYFNIDPTLPRIAFVLLTILTGGAWVLIYILLGLIIPPANSEKEIAEAHGETPITAQDLIERARIEYARFAGDRSKRHEWKKRMHDWKREWRREWRKERMEKRRESMARHNRCGGNGAGRAFGGIMIAALTVLWIMAIWSFVTTGFVFGYMIGIGQPMWVTLAFVTLLYAVLSAPFKFIGGRHCRGGGIFSTLIVLALLFYVANLLFPPVHVWWDTAIAYLQTVR